MVKSAKPSRNMSIISPKRGVAFTQLHPLEISLRQNTASLKSLSLPSISKSPYEKKKLVLQCRFIYSKAIERAFRRYFNCRDFDNNSPSSGRPNEPEAEIENLQQIYNDYLQMKKLLSNKHAHIRKINRELSDENLQLGNIRGAGGGSVKGGRTSLPSIRQRKNDRVLESPARSTTRLPSIDNPNT